MTKSGLLVLALACVLFSGCATMKRHYRAPSLAVAPPETASPSAVRADRMLVWRAHLTLQVWSVSNAVGQAVAQAERQDGFAQDKAYNGEESARLTLRIPVKHFKAAVAGLEQLGTVTYRNVTSEDVTDEYIDVDARLKNKIILRDRLRQLLDKARDVKDVLAVETELNRVQGDIDSMEGRIKSLRSQAMYATVTLTFERQPILGPLGYLCKGLWWGVRKLFVIRG